MGRLLTSCIDPIKLREKARLLRKETGDERWKAPSKQAVPLRPRRDANLVHLRYPLFDRTSLIGKR
jgi:hypothetical protein